MGAFHRYLERRRVLRLLAELERSLAPGRPSRPVSSFSLGSPGRNRGLGSARSTPG